MSSTSADPAIRAAHRYSWAPEDDTHGTWSGSVYLFWWCPPPPPPPQRHGLGCAFTCGDGEQNGDETGVDCGGPCGPC